jgi:hypothetical protein
MSTSGLWLQVRVDLERVDDDRSGIWRWTGLSTIGLALVLTGAFVLAVAIEEIVAHPGEPLAPEVVTALAIGVVLFIGFTAFAYWLTRRILVIRLALLAILVVLLGLVDTWPPLWPLAAVAVTVLAIVVAEAPICQRRRLLRWICRQRTEATWRQSLPRIRYSSDRPASPAGFCCDAIPSHSCSLRLISAELVHQPEPRLA